MCKLLVADDEDSLRNGIVKYVRLHTDRFSRIYQAENGEEAIECILQHQPDVVLLDVQMPRKTGIDVMKEAELAGIHPTFVLLSGYDEFKYAQAAIRFGAKEYLLKPVRAADILSCILKHLGEPQDTSGKYIEEAKSENDNRLVKRAMEYINEHYNEDLSLAVLADEFQVSRGYMSTLLTRQLGMGFPDYLNQIRVEHACLYLEQNILKNYEIAYKVGFNDDKYFSKVFKKIMGISPKEYKNHGNQTKFEKNEKSTLQQR